MLSGARTELPSLRYYNLHSWHRAQGVSRVSPVSSDSSYELVSRQLSVWGVTGSRAQRPFLYSDGKSGGGQVVDLARAARIRKANFFLSHAETKIAELKSVLAKAVASLSKADEQRTAQTGINGAFSPEWEDVRWANGMILGAHQQLFDIGKNAEQFADILGPQRVTEIKEKVRAARTETDPQIFGAVEGTEKVAALRNLGVRLSLQDRLDESELRRRFELSGVEGDSAYKEFRVRSRRAADRAFGGLYLYIATLWQFSRVAPGTLTVAEIYDAYERFLIRDREWVSRTVVQLRASEAGQGPKVVHYYDYNREPQSMADASSDGAYELMSLQPSVWDVTGSGSSRPFYRTTLSTDEGLFAAIKRQIGIIEIEAGTAIRSAMSIGVDNPLRKLMAATVMMELLSALEPIPERALGELDIYSAIRIQILVEGVLNRAANVLDVDHFGKVVKTFRLGLLHALTTAQGDLIEELARRRSLNADIFLTSAREEFDELVNEFGRAALSLSNPPYEYNGQDLEVAALFILSVQRFAALEAESVPDIRESYVGVVRQLFEEIREGVFDRAGAGQGPTEVKFHYFENPMYAHRAVADDSVGVDAARAGIDTVGLVGGPLSSTSAPFYRSAPSTVAGLVEETGETSGGAFEGGAGQLAGAGGTGASHQRVARQHVAGARVMTQTGAPVRAPVPAAAVFRPTMIRVR